MGILLLDKFFNHNQLDEKVWDDIVSGKRTGPSVGGFNTSVSQGKDEAVDEPCNPLTLNEAFSTVAKSNKPEVNKPEKLDRCVAELMSDPDFKPQTGRTKEESAFAICQASINKQSAEKALEKADGGHLHTEDDPEGEHTHPELEEEIEEKAKKDETHINIKNIDNNILIKKGDNMSKAKKTKEDVTDEEELKEEEETEETKKQEKEECCKCTA